jgi:hypothetical protein
MSVVAEARSKPDDGTPVIERHGVGAVVMIGAGPVNTLVVVVVIGVLIMFLSA